MGEQPLSAVPARPRRRGLPQSVKLLVSGLVCLLLAAVCGFLFLVQSLDGYEWPEPTTVPVDGHEHALRLPEERNAMVWMYEAITSPTCRFHDAQTAKPIRLVPTGGDYWRPGGSAGGYRAMYTFDSGSGRVMARCTGVAHDGFRIHVEPVSSLPPYLAGLGPFAWAAGGLGAAAVLMVALAAIAPMRNRRLHH